MRFIVPDNASDILVAALRNRLSWIAGEVEVRLPGPNRLGQTRRSGARQFLPVGSQDWAEPKTHFRAAVPKLVHPRSWDPLTTSRLPWTVPLGPLQAQRELLPARPPVGESSCPLRRQGQGRARFRRSAPTCAQAA